MRLKIYYRTKKTEDGRYRAYGWDEAGDFDFVGFGQSEFGARLSMEDDIRLHFETYILIPVEEEQLVS